MSWPAIDGALLDDVLDAIGVSSDDDVEKVVAGFRRWLPAGSTAKWKAIDREETPPGAEPRVALEERLAGSVDSWSCWPFCTGLAAILGARGHDVRIAVEHLRTGANVPLVDYHSVLIVDGSLVDPFLGPSAPIAPGTDVARPDAWGAWIPGERPDHLGARGGSSVFRYRQLADRLDERDVRAFCAISATHSGVGRRRTAHWVRDGRVWFVRDNGEGDDGEGDDGDGSATLRITSGGDDPFTQTRAVVATGAFEDLVRRIDDDETTT